MRVRPQNDDEGLNEAADNRCDGSACYAELRRSEFAEDQYIVKSQVDENRNQSRDHRNTRLAAFAKRARVHLFDGERNESYQHNPEVFTAVLKHYLR